MPRKIKIPKVIISVLIFAVVLNILRLFFFGTHSFIYILWNIFLAAVSFVMSSFILAYVGKKNFYNPIFIICFIVWFLFLPNAPYVVTDFIHLGEVRTVPVMYDIILLFSSSVVSMLLGLYSMEQMEKILAFKFTEKTIKKIMFFVILFTSFGIYLGRTLRFNSWDLFTNHQLLFKSIVEIFTSPGKHINAYVYTVMFFFLIFTSYQAFKNRKDEVSA